MEAVRKVCKEAMHWDIDTIHFYLPFIFILHYFQAQYEDGQEGRLHKPFADLIMNAVIFVQR